MFCKKCGKQIKDDILFCPHCGQKVTIPSINRQEEKTETPVGVQPEKKPVADEPILRRQEQAEKAPREAVSKSLILAVIIGVLIILVAVLTFMLFSKHSREEEDFSQEYERTVQEIESDNADAAEMPTWDSAADQDSAAVEEAAAEEPVQEEQPSQYILPESNSVYLTRADLEGMTKEECRLARNELYARHGRRFDDEELQGYFDSCDWYEGTIAPADFDDSVLNEYEVANRDLIVMYEEEQGYR